MFVIVALVVITPSAGVRASTGFSAGNTAQGDTAKVLQAAEVTAAKPFAKDVDTTLLRNTTSYSVSDAIRFVQGVQLKDYGGVGGLKSINVRGMGTQHTQVTFDGAPVGNAQNGIVDLGRFSSQQLSTIELQTNSTFGTARDLSLLSNIKLTTQAPTRTELTVMPRVSSFHTYGLSVAGSKVWKKYSLLATVEGLYTKGDYKFKLTKKNDDEVAYDTTCTRQNGKVKLLKESVDFFGRNLHVKQYLYLSSRGYPGASVREEPGRFINQDHQWDADFTVQATYKYKYTSHVTKFNFNFCHYKSDPRLDVSAMYVNNYYRQLEFYHSTSYSRLLTKFLSIGGAVDFQYNYLSANLVDFVYPSRYQVYAAVSATAFFEHFRFEASLLNHLMCDHTRSSETATAFNKTINKLLPTLQASYLSKIYAAQLTLKFSHRNPTFNDLYYTLIGNRDLDPESAWQVELQQRLVLGCLDFSLSAFYSSTTDKIVAVPTSNQFRWTMLNLGEVHAFGFEPAVSYRQKWRDFGLYAKFSYTYEHAQDITSEYDGQIPYIPYHAFSFVGNVSYKQWQLCYSVLYTGKRWDSTANIAENELKRWYTTDVSLSFTQPHYDVTLQVNNLFDQQYEIVNCYPMPGISFAAAVRIKLFRNEI